MNSALRNAMTVLVLGAAAAAANAYKLDISAVTGATTDVTLGAGTYEVSWIGKADGGLYDAWSYNTATSGNWRDAFTVTLGGSTFTVDKPTATPYANFATAQDALAAFKSSGYNVYVSTTGTNYQPNMSLGIVPVPTFTLSAPTVVSFGVPDNVFWDNTGGVSLNVTTVVPEPETIVLMLAGLAAVSGVLRRRQRAA